MNRIIVYISFIVTLFSCVNSEREEVLTPIINIDVNDQEYINNDSFPKGDVRRYGVCPNQSIPQNKLSQVIALASKGLPITFPKGIYKTNLVFKDVSNVNFIFQEATINGAISILDGSSKLRFDGKLTLLDKLFIRKSNNITFDTMVLKSDTLVNIYHKKNRGVSIYAGSKKVSFNYLKIEDAGGKAEDFYKYTAAALQIHGWNNNPEQVYINKLEINNSDRTALYITGKGHHIGKAIIHNFGLGSGKNMFGLEDAGPGEETEFTGTWVNRCNDCVIDSLSISNDGYNGMYSLRMDEGLYHEPTFISNIHFGVKAKKLSIKDDELTNILVKNEY